MRAWWLCLSARATWARTRASEQEGVAGCLGEGRFADVCDALALLADDVDVAVVHNERVPPLEGRREGKRP